MSKGKSAKDTASKSKTAKREESADRGVKSKASKSKAAKAKSSRSRTTGQDLAATGAPGQRLYDMPYSAPAPRLINPDLGLHNLVTRAGHNAGYTIDVTLLDAPDHRLIRSGVLLAHRVLDGRGEWYLGAPDWQPPLPAERVVPMSQADLPEEFAELTRPFRRRAALGPVAALTCERREFALRDDRGTTLALLRDDKVTVRRGGLTTARYREVMLTPAGPGLTGEQSGFLTRSLAGAGATQVARLPRLVTRLGAPATGLTDFPAPQTLEPDVSFGAFVSHLLATRLRQLLASDLTLRTQLSEDPAELVARAGQLRLELKGLSPMVDVDVDWLSDLDEELEWVCGAESADSAGAAGQDRLGWLRGERYLTLLDRLVTAARAPHLGDASTVPAAEVLDRLLGNAVAGVVSASEQLTVDAPDDQWRRTGQRFEQLTQVTAVAQLLLPERVDRLRHRLGVASQLLGEHVRHSEAAASTAELAAAATPEQAFALGRDYEHELGLARTAREAFVRRWTKTARKLG